MLVSSEANISCFVFVFDILIFCIRYSVLSLEQIKWVQTQQQSKSTLFKILVFNFILINITFYPRHTFSELFSAPKTFNKRILMKFTIVKLSVAFETKISERIDWIWLVSDVSYHSNPLHPLPMMWVCLCTTLWNVVVYKPQNFLVYVSINIYVLYIQ